MASSGDTGFWVTIGTSVGGFVSGIASVLGINRARGKTGESNVVEVSELKRELEQQRDKVSQLEVMAGQYKLFGDTLNQVHDALKRVHQRMDGVEQKLARLEGFEQGRQSREASRKER